MNRIEKARRKIDDRVYRDIIGAPPDSKWTSLVALLTERGYASRVIRKKLKLPAPLNSTDRWVLEQRIFPHYQSNPAIRDVLFVGCDSYTAHYQRSFFPTVNYTTIEPDPARSRFGASRHIVAPLEELAAHAPADAFDLIVCNGVFGWGLDSLEQCEPAFAHCHTCLRTNGHLILGWDDLPSRVPLPHERITSLARFRRYVFPEFGSWRFLTPTPFRHTFDFYQK
jgi:SAM-dependent methyltransferase